MKIDFYLEWQSKVIEECVRVVGPRGSICWQVGRYETINWWSKTDDYVWHLDPIRVPSKEPGKRHYKGPKKGQVSSNGDYILG